MSRLANIIWQIFAWAMFVVGITTVVVTCDALINGCVVVENDNKTFFDSCKENEE